MLSHISHKFHQPSLASQNEPRAALFLNRFTRTLTVMYATGGIEDVLGIPASVMRGRSFYYCISENCLPDAVKCLENAKGNDSIAYLRFWFRDPRLDDEPVGSDEPSDDSDEEMTTDTSVDQEFGGGVQLQTQQHMGDASEPNTSSSDENMDLDQERHEDPSRTSSGTSTAPQSTHEAIFGNARAAESSTSSLPLSPEEPTRSRQNNDAMLDPIELEAVISCTSDGLVVCLRRARPLLPSRGQVAYENGLFAAPWAVDPIIPPIAARPQPVHSHNFAPSLGPQYAQAHDHVRSEGPAQDDFMNSIREQAIFAWALTGINGTLHKYALGHGTGDSLPQDGLPVWRSDPSIDLIRSDSGPTNIDGPTKGSRERDIFGDPGLDRSFKSTPSSSGYASRGSDGDFFGR